MNANEIGNTTTLATTVGLRAEFRVLLEKMLSKRKPLPFCSVLTKIDQCILPYILVKAAESSNGSTEILVPISMAHVESLKNMGTQAPFGKGFETLIDKEVRDTLQIHSENVEVNQNVVQKLLQDLLKQMGIDANFEVEAKLYKLLIYSEKGHFVKHRDTEKEKGMFATMIIQVPCEEDYEGGLLTINHNGKREIIDFKGDCQSKYSAVFFYADCEHELEPITRGHRVVLAYNIIWKRDNLPMNMMVKEGRDEGTVGDFSRLVPLGNFVQKWQTALVNRDSLIPSAKPMMTEVDPNCLFQCIPLEHQYTRQNLSFLGLKGNDSFLAALLTKCPNLQVFLALKCKYMKGYTEESFHDHTERIQARFGYWEEHFASPPEEIRFDEERNDHFSTVDRYHQIHYKIECMLDLYGTKLSGLLIPKELSAINDASSFASPAERQQLEYMGNDGYSLEKWYYSACLFIAPKDCFYQWLYEKDKWALVGFISSSLFGSKSFYLVNHSLPVVDSLLQVDKFLALSVEKSDSFPLAVSPHNLQNLLLLCVSFNLPLLKDQLFNYVTEDSTYYLTSRFENFVQWSTEAVLGLVLLLVPLGDSVLLCHFRDIMVDAGNEQTITCLLHRFLTSERVWEEVKKHSDCVSFLSFMKSLCVSRIAELKSVEEPESESWAFPWVSLPDFRIEKQDLSKHKLLNFLESEYDVCESFLFNFEDDAESFLMALNNYPFCYSLRIQMSEELPRRSYVNKCTITIQKKREYFEDQLQLFDTFQECIEELEERNIYLESL
jgi:predicted 2-oxoglutarate/Fe(II)-dependent dioxygenase YbiX